MKQILTLFLSLFLVTYLQAQTATKPNGSGTSTDPYQIATLDNLYWVTQNSSSWGSDFIQTADINAGATKNWNSGAGFSPIGDGFKHFAGRYDGQGHLIDSLYINSSSHDEVGLFGAIGTSGVVTKLGLTHANITGTFTGQIYTGGIVAFLYGTVSYVFVSGKVTSTYGETAMEAYAGGIVGENSGGTLENSFNMASVSVTPIAAGGPTPMTYAGGLAAQNGGASTIKFCYSAATISGSGSAALIGSNIGTVSNCFWDSDVAGTTGMSGTKTGAVGKTTAEMKTLSTFIGAGWDFKGETTNGTGDTWNMNTYNNSGYPSCRGSILMHRDRQYLREPVHQPILIK